MATITVRIKSDGSCILETGGIAGAACMDATKSLESMFVVQETKATADYYLPEPVPSELEVQNGN